MSYYEPWMLALIARVEQFENEHSFDERRDCMQDALDQVPVEALNQAAGFALAIGLSRSGGDR